MEETIVISETYISSYNGKPWTDFFHQDCYPKYVETCTEALTCQDDPPFKLRVRELSDLEGFVPNCFHCEKDIR